SLRRTRCFNGAVARTRRRRITIDASNRLEMAKLQWSRRANATETIADKFEEAREQVLQWSRRANATETAWALLYGGKDVELQWSRRANATETDRVRAAAEDAACASMEPS